MAQSILHLGRRSRDSGSDLSQPERKHLGVEKLGVVGGFLIGLPVGIALVGDPLSSFGAPQWLVVGMTALVVAVFTRIGLSLGSEDLDADEP